MWFTTVHHIWLVDFRLFTDSSSKSDDFKIKSPNVIHKK